MLRFRRLTVTVVCGFLFVVDRVLKWQALHGWQNDALVSRWFGWHPFLNPGVAFGIPVPGWLIIFLTVPVLGLILFQWIKEQVTINKKQANEATCNWQLFIVSCSLLIIFAGALSNLLDRLLYGHTVDYLLIFTGVINLADVMIVAGGVVYWWYQRNTSA